MSLTDELLPLVVDMWSDKQKKKLANDLYKKIEESIASVEVETVAQALTDYFSESYVLESVMDNVDTPAIGKKFSNLIIAALDNK